MSTEAKVANPEERIPYRLIRRKTGEKMLESVQKIPHVTHFDEADMTELRNLRKELAGEAEQKGIKLSFLPFVVKALIKAFGEHPSLNAVLDEKAQEIVHKKYFNMGIAVAAEQGLFVPVVKNAESKDIWQLADEIKTLADKVRAGKIQLPDIQGGTFTITNIGPLGGTHATPIILHPQTAILGLMKMQEKPVVVDGQIVIRSMMNVALSFDHRVLDGAEVAIFTSKLCRMLEHPRDLLA
jgi:pyruvate/2-oxoglutarate dehydrogenase complex dihydrolipoamide acyltransferase (E2) component